MRKLFVSLLTCVTAFAAAPALSADAPPGPYPKGDRQWTQVKSMVIQPGDALYNSFGGIHHLDANMLAEKSHASGKFPDGAVIAFDLLTATCAENTVQEWSRSCLRK